MKMLPGAEQTTTHISHFLSRSYVQRNSEI